MGNILHFLLGSVRIEVNGRFPERFVNLCGVQKIRFWDVERREDHALSLCVDVLAVRRCRTLAAQALCELRVVEGQGLPSILLGLRRRLALLLGLGCALLTALVLSQFVLVVRVTGNVELSDSVILTELENQGFGPLTYGPGVDRRTLANEVLLRLPQLSFLSVNISGIYAEVVVREAAPEPELEDRWAAGDVVAAADGVILDVDPVIGSPVVTEGQAVLAGEVLISGTEEQQRGDGTGTVLSAEQVRAEGRVKALTRRVLRCATPLECAAKSYTGKRQRVLGLRLLRRCVKIPRESSFFPRTCDRIEKVWQPTLPGGAALPLSLERRTLTEYQTRTARLKRETAEQFLRERLEARLTALLGERGEVQSRDITFREEDGVLFGTLTASCVEDIAVMRPRTSVQPPAA